MRDYAALIFVLASAILWLLAQRAARWTPCVRMVTPMPPELLDVGEETMTIPTQPASESSDTALGSRLTDDELGLILAQAMLPETSGPGIWTLMRLVAGAQSAKTARTFGAPSYIKNPVTVEQAVGSAYTIGVTLKPFDESTWLCEKCRCVEADCRCKEAPSPDHDDLHELVAEYLSAHPVREVGIEDMVAVARLAIARAATQPEPPTCGAWSTRNRLRAG